MIHGISANQPTFHPVEFTVGLNIILAERTLESTQKDTRNGLGKSTLIEIIHFCLGSSVTKGKGLIKESLTEWNFTIDITLAGNRVEATRAIASPNWISVVGSTDNWIEQPELDEKTGKRQFNLKRWKILLGWALFGLPRTFETVKYKPTYRSLFSYFVRLGNDAYSDPFRHVRQQRIWNIQLNIAYLLGLNWEHADQWQNLKDQENGIKAFESAIKSKTMDGSVGHRR